MERMRHYTVHIDSIGATNMHTALLPMFSETISAGFPSPAQGYMEDPVSLNDLCIKHPAATFLVICEGNAMEGFGIGEGDILVVDRSLSPRNEDVVIVEVDGLCLVRKLLTRVQARLVASTGDAIILGEKRIIGVVSNRLRPLHDRNVRIPPTSI